MQTPPIEFASNAFLFHHSVGFESHLLGILSLKDARLRWSDLDGTVTFDEPVTAIANLHQGRLDAGTQFHFETGNGTKWVAAFYTGPRGMSRPPRTNPVGVWLSPVVVTDRDDARDACDKWFRILQNPAVLDPAMWNPERDGY